MSCFSLLRTLFLLVSLLRPVCIAASGRVARALPTIIDTDIGTFMDDTFALAFALESPELDVQLVVTASHETTGRARVAAKHLSLAGMAHIPIGIGVPTSTETGPLFGWAAEYDLASYPGGVHKDGVRAMQQAIDSCEDAIMTLIEIGPHTNVKALLERFPGIERRVRVVVMGGSIVPDIHLPWGHVTPVNTTNERVDPVAARAMLHANWSQPLTFAPIATTYQVVIQGFAWRKLRRSSHRSVKLVLECYDYWWNESRSNSSWITYLEAMSLDPSRQSNILFDAEAVYLAIASQPQWLTLDQFTVDFSDYGQTQVLPRNASFGSAAWFALNWTAGSSVGARNLSGLALFCNYLTSRLLSLGPKAAGASGFLSSSSVDVVQV